ncbi:hypothetical protein [Atopomonas sediminilitoris]|uniref:hypothetical protein n=1 Tax=Atopomonas sediminilitoris TaxID=2919919 RepID=UPI001F4D89BC|nr:hypothetical protein [Atopomonas sediminilitoris]MCJ8167743.1 hypothetical protein [Atopomonas sediminilitoris]
MLQPMVWITPRWRTRCFLAFAALALVLVYVMAQVGARLINESVPQGIISFELAESLEASLAIQVAWGEKGRQYAALSLGLDYFFLLVYGLALSLACVCFAAWGEDDSRLARLMPWLPLAAATMDALENYALIRLLFGEVRGGWVLLARDSALIKFALLALVALYLLYALALVLRVRWLSLR